MKGLTVIVPEDIEKIKQHIYALEWALSQDKDDLSREIHTQALKAYRDKLEMLTECE